MKNLTVKDILTHLAKTLNLGDIIYSYAGVDDFTSTGKYLLSVANLLSAEIAQEYDWSEFIVNKEFSNAAITDDDCLALPINVFDKIKFKNLACQTIYVSVKDGEDGDKYLPYKPARQSTKDERLLLKSKDGEFLYHFSSLGLHIYPKIDKYFKVKLLACCYPPELRTLDDIVKVNNYLLISRMICFWKMSHGENYDEEYKNYRRMVETIVADENKYGVV